MEEGDEPLKPIWDVLIELVIVVIVGAVLLAIVFKASQNDIFEKRFLSKDMALLLDTLYASRGNSVFVYGNSLNFSFDFRDSRAGVYNKPRDIKKYTTNSVYLFTESSSVDFSDKELISEKKALKPIFAKLGSSILVKDKDEFFYDINEIKCYSKKKLFSAKEKILAIVSFSGRGNVSEITNHLYAMAQSNFKHIYLQEEAGASGDLGGDIIIGVAIGDFSRGFKAFISSDSEYFYNSESLACSILDSIMENKELKNLITDDAQQISIVPVEGIEALKKERIGVLLEIGKTYASDSSVNRLIALSINEGIKGVFS